MTRDEGTLVAKDDHAIVVGIDRYPELKSLQGPVKDATAFRDWLTKSAKVPAKNIAMVLSPKSLKAKKPTARPVQTLKTSALPALDRARRQADSRASIASSTWTKSRVCSPSP